jgi:mRNA interferase RelE/StbE
MATYRIRFRSAARRDFAQLPPLVKARLGRAIDALRQEPRPAGALLLTGHASSIWRIRVGDYRVLYQILDDDLIVLVVGIPHRREAYRRGRISEPIAPYGPAPDRPMPHGGRSWSRDLYGFESAGGAVTRPKAI